MAVILNSYYASESSLQGLGDFDFIHSCNEFNKPLIEIPSLERGFRIKGLRFAVGLADGKAVLEPQARESLHGLQRTDRERVLRGMQQQPKLDNAFSQAGCMRQN